MNVKELLSEVHAEIAAGADKVIAGVRAALVSKELSEREAAVLSALGKLQEAERDSKKIKPDNELFDGEGKSIQTGFSKAKLEELKKNRELVEKLEGAIVKALGGDFSKVKELAGK